MKYLLLGMALLSVFAVYAIKTSVPTEAAGVCTMEYRPVCATKRVSCIKPDMTYGLGERDATCTEYKTYGNRCAQESDGATFIHEGECTDEELGQGSEKPTSPLPPKIDSEKKYEPLDREIKNVKPAPATTTLENMNGIEPSLGSLLEVFSRFWQALTGWF